MRGFFVPEAGIEPALLAEHEFESCASTSSATQAAFQQTEGKTIQTNIRLQYR